MLIAIGISTSSWLFLCHSATWPSRFCLLGQNTYLTGPGGVSGTAGTFLSKKSLVIRIIIAARRECFLMALSVLRHCSKIITANTCGRNSALAPRRQREIFAKGVRPQSKVRKFNST